MIKLTKLFVILITFSSCIANAGLLGASTFEECLLDNLKNASSPLPSQYIGTCKELLQ